MEIGEVIRKYRKEKQLTQEEMANYLGVTPPAVNKWENGNSYPDISLLAPIARLLNISTDVLLSYKDNLTEKEINQIISEISERVKNEDYDTVFQWAMNKVKEYPNCDNLIFMVAQVLDSYRDIINVQDSEKYDNKIHELYERTLHCNNQNLVQSALVALYVSCISKEEFEQAQKYLDQIPKQVYNPIKFQASLYKKQGKTEEAYELYEKLIFTGYGDLFWALQGLYSLAMKEDNKPKAERIIKKQEQMGELLDMSEYMKISPRLDFALVNKDKEECFRILQTLIDNLKDLTSFQHSELYSHMKFSENNDISNIAFMMYKGFEEDENIAFLKDDERYDRLIKKLKNYIERIE